MPNLDLSAISATRAGALRSEARLREVTGALTDAQARRDALVARGDEAGAAAATADARRLAADRATLVDSGAELRRRVGDLADELVRGRRPEQAVGSLSAAHPVLMLPVRLEARFGQDAQSLQVRVFPDQVHVSAHDPALTTDEQEGLRWYWTHRWPDRDSDQRADEAWQALAARIRPGRAAFLVRAYPPANLASAEQAPSWDSLPTRASQWSAAPQAALLPDRWCVLGFRRDGEGRHTELFRVWGSGVPDTLAAGPAPDPGAPAEPGGLPDDPALAWLHDPRAAERVGMLVTVRQQDLRAGARLSDGVDRLVALGVDWTLTPEQAAAAVEAHLAAHADEGRLAFVPQGTPTNATGAVRSGYTTDSERAREVLAPHRAQPVTDGAAALTAAALGLTPGALDHLPGADLREQVWQRALADALWAATGGYFLTRLLDPVCEDPVISSSLRDHAVAHLRATGPLPTLRVGKQPYGVLPVLPRDRYRPPNRPRAVPDVVRVSAALRRLMEPLVAGVPRLAQVRSGADVDKVLVSLLQRTPVAWSLKFSVLLPPEQRRAMSVNWDRVAAFQRDVTATLFSELGCGTLTMLSELTHTGEPYELPVPMALRPEPTEEDPNRRGAGYLAEILEILRREDARDMLDGRSDALALLEALLCFAGVEELDAVADAVAKDAAPSLGLSPEFAAYLARGPAGAARVPSTMRVEAAGVAPSAAGGGGPAGGAGAGPVVASAVPRTARELSSTVLPALTGEKSLTQHVAADFAGRIDELGPLLERPADPAHRLARYTAALETLQQAPPEQLEWAFQGFLDLFATRLDAWVTSVASSRLAQQRAAATSGLHVGGFGVVEDLHPDRGPGAESLGFLHTPSLGQATSVAVLRSARASHRGEDGSVFDIDLSSRRVRQALRILEGVAAGQRLAALLGYRVERGLQERDLLLAQWILPLRMQCPLRSDRPEDPDPDVVEPVEVVAARDVVDGVALLDRWERDRTGLLQAAGVTAGPAQAGVSAVLDEVAALADAVSDLLVAEAVHQATTGNLERAGAALAAHDRQGLPPDPEFVRTPRAGSTVAHRVGVWLPANSTGTADGWAADLRSAAEPRLDHWLGAVLGDPARWTVRGRLVRPVQAEGEAPATVDLDPVPVASLGMGALSLVLAARRPGQGRPSELEARLATAFAAAAERAGLGPGPSDQLELLPGDWEQLLDLAGWAADVVSAPALGGADLVPTTDMSAGEDRQPATADGAEALARARTVRDTVAARQASLDAALAAFEADHDSAVARATLAAAMLALAEVAGTDALTGPDAAAGDRAGAGDSLADRAAVVAETVRARLSAADELSDGTELERARGVVTLLLGADQPLLPVLVPADPQVLAAPLAARSDLLAGEVTAAVSWLHRYALVRPALDPLAALLVHTEADGAPVADDLAVLQLPHRSPGRWAALPFGEAGPPPHGSVGLVLHAPDGIDPAAGGAGLLVDAWTETVPEATETTAVTFHYDSPGARAPQSLLLALHPDASATSWDFESLVATVHEAMDLARLRTLSSKELAPFQTFLPATFLPDSYTRDVPGLRLRELLETVAAWGAGGLVAKHVMGKWGVPDA